MNSKEVIKQLKELIDDRRSFMVGDYDECYDKDVQALEYAINELERTAQEVPVQEQSKEIIVNIEGSIIPKRFDCQKLINQLGNIQQLDR